MKIKPLFFVVLMSLTTLTAPGATRYVNVNNSYPEFPYDQFAKAATTIQDAVDAAAVGELILVTNGVYSSGGRDFLGTNQVGMTRVVVDKPLALRSLCGPEVTVIEGDQGNTVRCAYLVNGAILSGFTLTNGAARGSGGGILCESSSAVVTNCIVTKNEASSYGGGVYSGTLRNCTLTENAVVGGFGLEGWSGAGGGGAYDARLSDCVLIGNWAGAGGGGLWGTYSRCTIATNWARYAYYWGPNGYYFLTPGYGGGVCGGTLTNCILTGNWAVEGGGVYSATLEGCTLTGNHATNSGIMSTGSGGGACGGTLNLCTVTSNSATSGGGAASSVLKTCLLTGNLANSGGGTAGSSSHHCTIVGNSATTVGGGAIGGVLNNCLVVSNSSSGGGGTSDATLNNCTVVGNHAANTNWGGGGGARSGSINNCVVYFNTAPEGPNWSYEPTFKNCCTTPIPPNGSGHITNEPLFLNLVQGDLHLQTNSACINAGLNAAALGPLDLDGNPRVMGGLVDMGAYEFQSPASVLPYAWLQQYGLPTDGSADYADSDADGHNNWQEWMALTIPTNALSVLRLLSATPIGTNVVVSWQSVAGVTYHLLRSTNLCARPAFQLLDYYLVGEAGTTEYTDLDAARLAPVYYRVGVGDYIPPAPTLSWRIDAGARTLELSWSGTGFHLQAQTNSLGVGLTTEWFDYPGGESSPVTVPVDPAAGAVFYRLASW